MSGTESDINEYTYLPLPSKEFTFAASMFAGDSSFGDESIDIIESSMVSTVCTGDQRSEASS